MGLFSSSKPDPDPDGGRGSHKGGKSQVSNTSYRGSHRGGSGGKGSSGKGGKIVDSGPADSGSGGLLGILFGPTK